MESSFQLSEKAAFQSKDERNQECKTDATHNYIWPNYLFGGGGGNINNNHYCRKETDNIDDEQGHKVVSLALKICEEENCRYNKTREGNNGNNKLSPVVIRGDEGVNENQHYHRVGDELDKLACSVILNKIDGNCQVPDHIKAEQSDQRPKKSANCKVNYRAGNSRKNEWEAENSDELFSCCPLFAELGIGNINIHTEGSLLPQD